MPLLISVGAVPLGWSTLWANAHDVEPGIRQAIVAIQHGSPERAIVLCDAALEHGSRTERQRAWALSTRGVAYAMKKDFPRAFADCDEAIRLDPGFAVAHANRGQVHLENKAPELAIADCIRAIEQDPRLAIAHGNRAIAHVLLRKMDLALAEADLAITLDPSSAEAFLWRGSACNSKGNSNQAILDLGESIRLAPLNSMSYKIAA